MKAYEKLIKDNNLTIDELPQDAKIGINQIKAIENALDLQKRKAEKAGKTFTVPAATAAKIKSFDKWVAGEIIDYLDDKNANPDKPPVAAKEIIADIKDENTEGDDNINHEGAEIDKELAAMFKSGKLECTLEELKSLAPKAEAIIFNSYKAGEENGIITSHFTLIEKSDKFVLTKK